MKRYMTEAQINKAARQAAGRIAMDLWREGFITAPNSRRLLRIIRENVGRCVRLNAKPEKR